MQLIQQLGLETYVEYTEGQRLMQLGDDNIRCYTGDIPSLPWLSLLDLHLFIAKVNLQCLFI
jgi:monoamine oxidase